MVGGRDVVRVLNCSAFHDTQLVCSGDLAYLGGSWSKNVGCAVSFFILYYAFFFVVIFQCAHEIGLGFAFFTITLLIHYNSLPLGYVLARYRKADLAGFVP
jgi:hypothetical protein